MSLRASGIVSAEKFQWRGLETLVYIRVMLLDNDLGKKVERAESA